MLAWSVTLGGLGRRLRGAVYIEYAGVCDAHMTIRAAPVTVTRAFELTDITRDTGIVLAPTSSLACIIRRTRAAHFTSRLETQALLACGAVLGACEVLETVTIRLSGDTVIRDAEVVRTCRTCLTCTTVACTPDLSFGTGLCAVCIAVVIGIGVRLIRTRR